MDPNGGGAVAFQGRACGGGTRRPARTRQAGGRRVCTASPRAAGDAELRRSGSAGRPATAPSRRGPPSDRLEEPCGVEPAAPPPRTRAGNPRQRRSSSVSGSGTSHTSVARRRYRTRRLPARREPAGELQGPADRPPASARRRPGSARGARTRRGAPTRSSRRTPAAPGSRPRRRRRARASPARSPGGCRAARGAPPRRRRGADAVHLNDPAPARHCPRSLSGVRMRTCSTSSRNRAAPVASASSASNSRIDQTVTPERAHRLLHGVELREQLRRHALLGLVPGEEVVPERADRVVERDGDVGHRLAARRAGARGASSRRRPSPSRPAPAAPCARAASRSGRGRARTCRRRGGRAPADCSRAPGRAGRPGLCIRTPLGCAEERRARAVHAAPRALTGARPLAGSSEPTLAAAGTVARARRARETRSRRGDRLRSRPPA